MFQPEHIWGVLLKGMTNRLHPEVTMINAYADLQVAMFSGASAFSGLDIDPGVQCPEYWFKEESACDRDIKTQPGPEKPLKDKEFSEKEYRDLHKFYRKLLPDYGNLWNEAFHEVYDKLSVVEAYRAGYDKETGEWVSHATFIDFFVRFRTQLPQILGYAPEPKLLAMAAAGLCSGASSHRSMLVGKVRFKVDPVKGGSWALARPPIQMATNAEGEVIEQPDFGQVEGIYSHTGPDGVVRLICNMKWYESVPEGHEIYHASLRCPVISQVELLGVDEFWCARDIVPWTCMAFPDPRNKHRQIMLARSWSVLRHLGFPDQEYTYPFIGLPAVGRVRSEGSAERAAALAAARNQVFDPDDVFEDSDAG